MIKAEGQSVQQGIAIGKILIRENRPVQIVPEKTDAVEKEWAMFLSARKRAVAEVKNMEAMAKEKVGDKAMIFSVHAMLLEEAEFEEAVRKGIKEEHYNASYAVYLAGKEAEHFFANVKDNAYLNERSVDFRDISDRVIRELQHIRDEIILPEHPVILVTDDLTPAELISLDMTKILAVVLNNGSVNSHTAIIAKSMTIPMLVNTDAQLSVADNGRRGIVDGVSGTFWVDPDEETLSRLIDARNAYEKEQKELEQMIGKAAVTKSGRSIRVCANIGNIEDARRAGLYQAEGIGLFRSEFLYLNGTDFPTEEQQFENYRTVAQIMEGREVIIRTMDICADKQADYVRLDTENNPAMGLRAIRFCFRRPEIFRTQLRAIYRAGIYGKLGIMFPMITSEEEVDKILAMMADIREELKAEGVKTGELKAGIMIETPAAALISDRLAGKVDFFSIGTNDLTQYTLAMDRQNADLKEFQNIHHPSILKMIEMTVENAHAAHIKVGICGELAADPELTDYFIRLGVDSLSVPASEILTLRKHIRELP
ncbi:MAG: phosphoenolpyruvate--protein phosphotransferase [Lachnospiraceae bacterium]|nr:phosphoenolpyruvate--protein phosphotransferase [Lachnospiraceae bacterium]